MLAGLSKFEKEFRLLWRELRIKSKRFRFQSHAYGCSEKESDAVQKRRAGWERGGGGSEIALKTEVWLETRTQFWWVYYRLRKHYTFMLIVTNNVSVKMGLCVCGTYGVHLQGWWMNEARNVQELGGRPSRLRPWHKNFQLTSSCEMIMKSLSQASVREIFLQEERDARNCVKYDRVLEREGAPRKGE
jgi:hypothetical protein